MKILLLGSTGYLGSYLFRNLEIDVDTSPNSSAYDILINCTGLPHLETCQSDETRSEISNYLYFKKIADAYPNSHLISFSSYYVYDSDMIADEFACTTDRYNYTRHKLLCEKFVQARNGVSFRLGKLYGGLAGSQKKLLDSIIQERTLTVDHVLFNPTSLRTVSSVVRKQIRDRAFNGVVNLSDAGYCSHFQFASRAISTLKLIRQVEVIERLDRDFHNYGKFCMSTSLLNSVCKPERWEVELDKFLLENNYVKYR